MKVIAAYLLAVLGGNTCPSAGDLKCILESVGAEVDDGRIDFLLSEVKGKDLAELIAAGREKFASVPSGGGVAAVAVAATGGGGAAAAAEEPKKEEKVEEKEESDDVTNLEALAAAATVLSKMKVIAAYLLAVLGGNTCPSAGDLKCILESVGAEVDDGRIDFLLSEVKGKDIAELIAAGREKFASVPSGGGVAAVAVAAPGGGGAAAAAEEPKKEEKVEEKEESDDDMGFSLFD
ncbi:hypothetical protein Cni_G00226 [Canna indica]|uniref:60S acidic ribosomal protein P2 n=1 Tax=Canna indica TaxID=4628 RepID=A0AAQ3JM35_9LILI|nr:hypothetical protein Cni_G00226 [Canna indica]